MEHSPSLYGDLDRHLLEKIEEAFPVDEEGKVRVPARLVMLLLQKESQEKVTPHIPPASEELVRAPRHHAASTPITPKMKAMKSKRTRSANASKSEILVHTTDPASPPSDDVPITDNALHLGLIERRYEITSPRLLGILHQHKCFRDFSAMERFHDIPFAPTAALQLLSYLQGPGDSTSPTHTYGTYASGRSISTYPAVKDRPYREGDPICDRFAVRLYENRTVAAIADGHQWGNSARKAAKRAVRWFVSTLEQSLKEATNLKNCGPVLLSSLAHAHERILRSQQVGSWSRATSLLGGAVFEVDLNGSQDLENSLRYPFIFSLVSVGRCRCYHFSKQSGLLTDHSSTTTPGITTGYIGGIGNPDLRDLNLTYIPCDEDDLIIMCTPGVSDNFDPVLRGEMSENEDNALLRNKMSLELAQSLVGDNPTVTSVVENWIEHAKQTTRISREFIEEDSSRVLSSNRKIHPGKMDHATCICFRVGRVTLSYREWMSGR